jgi:hypothetical protein
VDSVSDRRVHVVYTHKVTRYAKRTDANHAEIRAGLRARGWDVSDLSGAHGGVPDLVCALPGRPGLPFFLEIKDGDKPLSAQKLTAKQEIWHRYAWQITAKVRNLDEALEALEWAKKRAHTTPVTGTTGFPLAAASVPTVTSQP